MLMSRNETDEIQIRHEHGEAYPAIDVKTHGLRLITGEDVQKAFPLLNEYEANQAAEALLEEAILWFWNTDAPEACRRNFPGQVVEVRQAGRSGGWLIVEGLKPVTDWSHSDKVDWYCFQREIYNIMLSLADVESTLLKAYRSGIYLP